MDIRAEVTLPYPRERVFITYRDRLEELMPFLPNLRGVEIKKREERGSELYQVNLFKGGGEIPAAARSLIREEMLSWTDHATWDHARWRCSFRTEVHAFPGVLQSSGTNLFFEADDGSRIVFGGALTCDASKIPGVPRLLVRSINGAVEKFFVGKIVENLVAVGKGIGKLLAREP
jgi:hypothetical protein